MTIYPPPQPQPDQKAKLERTELRLKVAAAFLGLLGAIVTVLGVSLGLFVKKSSTANDRVDTSQQQVQALESQNSALESENSSLKRRISELESTPTSNAPSAESREPTTPPDSGATPLVRNEGPLTITQGSTVDLDAFDDPQWGTTKRYNKDFIFTGSRLGLYGGQWVALGEAGDYGTCRTAQPYTKDRIQISVLQRSKTICVLTGDGRQSVMTVKSVSASRLSFEIVTYNKNGD